ncbi:MAG: ABC transporter ATP-binding protein [Defluviicoccus sp.]|nr:ABC transporter ATP-binding protein [Defluviicoccus sp.]
MPLLRMERITKTFPGVVANDRIDLAVDRGEIHALLGENGSGKTTLMNALYGLHRPDSGRILLDGAEVRFSSPMDAIAAGIGMVHQHFMLVPPLTVVENIVLGLKTANAPRSPLLDLRTAAARVRELAATYGLDIDTGAQIWQLPVGAQQRVEILKALYRDADLLILDEPTAVLAPSEVRHLIGVLRGLAASGKAVIFISHKLNEVMEVADRISVLRGGRLAGTVAAAETDPAELARLMVGRDIVPPRRREGRAGDPVLRIEALRVRDDRGLRAGDVVGVSLSSGEILGIAGVDGNGQKELTEAIAGVRAIESGALDLTGLAPSRGERFRNIGHVTEDRHHTGLLMSFPLWENLALKSSDRPPFGSPLWLRVDAMRRATARAIETFSIRAQGPDSPVSALSGGNQQKLVLARELGLRPRLLLAAQPTRGLDVGATEYIHQRLLAARDEGMAILLVSTELDEVLALSDRVLVMYEGRAMGLVDAGEATRETVGMMMAGMERHEAAVQGGT